MFVCKKYYVSHIMYCYYVLEMSLAVCFVIVCRKSTFQKNYSHIIYLTNDPQLWLVYGELIVNPPLMRRTIGRPKKMRNKINDEPKNPHVLSRKLPTVTYHKCGFMEHYMRTCKRNGAANIVMPNGGNKKKNSKITEGNKKKSNKSAT